jgi:hypothetical protein
MTLQQRIDLFLPQYVANYLKKYSYDNWKLEYNNKDKFNNIIVIPAVDEYENIRKLLLSLSENNPKYFQESLFMFVINNKVTSSKEIKDNNAKSIELLRAIIVNNRKDILTAKIIGSGLKIGLVDAVSEKYVLPEKDGGVGLARKIGMDLALSVFDYQNNRKKILICLDADCTVEKNYLQTIIDEVNQQNICAGYVRYEHQLPDEEENQRAIICYEIFLRYYVLGLKYANSPYAFHTIGSTMICDAENYCKIGGMNKRKAAEDFYFLEKLAKVISIQEIKNTRVYPSSRESWRVPFGTGQRVNRFLSQTHDEYLLYHPHSFMVLKEWVNTFHSETIKSEEFYLSEANKINSALRSFLECNSFAEDWKKVLNNSKSLEQVSKQKRMWFDGFRTLKLIHYLRDEVYPQINMFDAVDGLMELMGLEAKIERKDAIPSIMTQIAYLNLLRKHT